MSRFVFLSILLGIVISSVCVFSAHGQLLHTEVPNFQNEQAGYGFAGCEVVGNWCGQDASTPAIAFGIPTAYGANWKDVFGGLAYQRGLRGARDAHDGALFAGFGGGNSRRTIGIEVTYAMYDVAGDTGEDGSFSVKLHRHVYKNLSLAAGIENIVRYGEAAAGSKSAYVVASNIFTIRKPRRLFSAFALTVGVGDGRFNRMENILSGKNEASLFGSVGLRITQAVGVVGTWFGQDMSLGVSIALPEPVSLRVTPVVTDVTGEAGYDPRFAVAVGGAYRF